MTFVEFIEYFRIWGPLGIWAGLTTWGCVHLYRNGRSDAKAAAAKAEEAAAAHAAQLKLVADGHHEQMTEMTDRFVALHTQGASENRELTQQVRSLIEVVSRKRGR